MPAEDLKHGVQQIWNLACRSVQPVRGNSQKPRHEKPTDAIVYPPKERVGCQRNRVGHHLLQVDAKVAHPNMQQMVAVFAKGLVYQRPADTPEYRRDEVPLDTQPQLRDEHKGADKGGQRGNPSGKGNDAHLVERPRDVALVRQHGIARIGRQEPELVIAKPPEDAKIEQWKHDGDDCEAHEDNRQPRSHVAVGVLRVIDDEPQHRIRNRKRREGHHKRDDRQRHVGDSVLALAQVVSVERNKHEGYKLRRNGVDSEKDYVLRKALVFVQTRLQAKLYSILPDAMRRSVPRNILQRTASGSRFCQQASCLSE